MKEGRLLPYFLREEGEREERRGEGEWRGGGDEGEEISQSDSSHNSGGSCRVK